MKWFIGGIVVISILIGLQIYSPLREEKTPAPQSQPESQVLGTTSEKTEFLVLGDSGIGSAQQRMLAEEMQNTNATFFLHVGDIAYQRGTADELRRNFANIYTALLKKVKVYPSPGNHDYSTNNLAPYLSYFNPPHQALNDADQGRYYSFDAGNIHFVSLDSNTPLDQSSDSRNDDELDWLNQDLAKSNAQFKIVFFHHPPYSSGIEHGSDMRVRQKLVPIFEKYKVDLVFNGHEHNYERTCKMLADKCDDQGILYIVTGGGGAGLYRLGEPQYFSVARSVNYEFVNVTIEECKLNAQVIGLSSKILDSFSLNKCS